MKGLAELTDAELTALLAASRKAVKEGAEEWDDEAAWLARDLSERYGCSWDFDGWRDTVGALEQIRYERQ